MYTTVKLIVNFLQSIEEEIHTERVSYCRISPQCLTLKSGTLTTILSPQEHINLRDRKTLISGQISACASSCFTIVSKQCSGASEEFSSGEGDRGTAHTCRPILRVHVQYHHTIAT